MGRLDTEQSLLTAQSVRANSSSENSDCMNKSADSQAQGTHCDMSGALLAVKGISKSDPSNARVLLHPVDISILAGDRIVLSGPSGSGKSVFLRCLAQIEVPNSGEFYFKGKLINQGNIQRYRTQVNYVRQNPVLVEGSVNDNLRLALSLRLNQNMKFDEDLLRHYLSFFNKPESFLQQSSAVLSGGERQIVSFLRNLMLSPSVLLLDEPTAALDPDSVESFERLVNEWYQAEPERAYIWISHDPQQAERMAEKQWFMQAGHVEFE